MPQGEWVFVTGVFSPGKFMRVYLNGKLDGEKSSGVPNKIQVTTTTPFTVGAITASTGYSFKGVIDEVAVYSRALTSKEIESIMRAGVLSIEPLDKWLLHGVR